jgi:hypothetical protein
MSRFFEGNGRSYPIEFEIRLKFFLLSPKAVDAINGRSLGSIVGIALYIELICNSLKISLIHYDIKNR